MGAFEFTFSIFGLLLGFTLVEVLRGAAALLQVRHKVNVGWLTPLLSLFVMLDVLSFWTMIWAAREFITASYRMLVFGLLLCGLYYAAASLVFPDNPETPQYDTHYFKHRRIVLLVILLCNNLSSSAMMLMMHRLVSARVWVVYAVYTLCVIAAVISNNRKVNILALAGLSGTYLYYAMIG